MLRCMRLSGTAVWQVAIRPAGPERAALHLKALRGKTDIPAYVFALMMPGDYSPY